MTARTLTLLATTLSLGACAFTPEQISEQKQRDKTELATALGDRVAGEPVNCIDSSQVDGPQIVGDNTLIYRQGSRLYRNTLVDECPSLRGDPIIVAEIFGGQICRNDWIRTVQRTGGIKGPHCRLGNFTPYKVAAR